MKFYLENGQTKVILQADSVDKAINRFGNYLLDHIDHIQYETVISASEAGFQEDLIAMKHKALDQTHRVLTSQIFYAIAHERLEPPPNISEEEIRNFFDVIDMVGVLEERELKEAPTNKIVDSLIKQLK